MAVRALGTVWRTTAARIAGLMLTALTVSATLGGMATAAGYRTANFVVEYFSKSDILSA